ncbi:MAG: bacteriohemerythrin [Gammaproteobacteria bacterium]|nr:bacteriohemerythrin [Gammaproteobacteria bacterium]
MPHIEWTDDLNTHITIIDNQHKRIVDFINQLYDAQENHDKVLVNQVITDLVDYTTSHFSFEENLLEQAEYPFLIPHKKVHQLFIKKINSFVERSQTTDEDLTDELLIVLERWLINHIKTEDQNYVNAVGKNIENVVKKEEKKGKLSSFINRFFG